MARTNHHEDVLTNLNHLKCKIAISGAAETGHCAIDAVQKAEQLGQIMARMGIVTVTGATTGMPYWVAKGAKKEGGLVIGISPAASEMAHIKSYRLPVDYHDIIIYTGFDYTGRNLLLTRAADAVIILCGRIGTLNEFTIAFENKTPIGVLTGTGGIADKLEGIVKDSHRGPGHIVYDSDPETLVKKLHVVMERVKKENYGRNHADLGALAQNFHAVVEKERVDHYTKKRGA
ncbi:MAG: hypothetical protein AAB407_01120 [Patescibacteria group bacterium]